MIRKPLHTLAVAAFLILALSLPAFAAPALEVDRAVFDFGSIPQGKKLDHVFKLMNKGDSPLTISRTRTSCGCTVANVSTKTIAPGKSADLKISFDSANFGGKVTKTITVESNDPASPTTTLTIKGIINEELVMTPRQMNLGQTKVGSSKEVSVTLENHGERTVRILSVTTPMPQVKAAIKKQTLKPGEKTQVAVTVSPRPEDRFLSGFIIIATDIPGKPEITLPLYGSVAK
ncbi:DUF1573 domain-containing protein [Geobacter hydrogenophilus]|uniref:HYDIN/VesB/CFA65-like Ig-like domain-containing protein n=1 Tax=Geobacter hydrogenophilus TaxID=40983 RepID=A0A9W6FYA7_9BACT|nr:DUF1573 domain-containing protein [Geobacter hydrogenophilus]MBT0895014.1 DUF1573 domain-containing protein [Geobacter hydrogenophilus]GLI37013.1 hypothetical protein GHYDROH2_05140 [Geobacter hydrogenophilus]